MLQRIKELLLRLEHQLVQWRTDWVVFDTLLPVKFYTQARHNKFVVLEVRNWWRKKYVVRAMELLEGSYHRDIVLQFSQSPSRARLRVKCLGGGLVSVASSRVVVGGHSEDFGVEPERETRTQHLFEDYFTEERVLIGGI